MFCGLWAIVSRKEYYTYMTIHTHTRVTSMRSWLSTAKALATAAVLAVGIAAVGTLLLPGSASAEGEDYIRITEENIRVEGGILAQPGSLNRLGTVNGTERYSGGVTLRGEPGIRISGEGTCDYTLVIEVRGDQVNVIAIQPASTMDPGCQIVDALGGTEIKERFSQTITLRNAIDPEPVPPSGPPPIPTDSNPPLGCPQSAAPRDPPPPECQEIPKGCAGSVPNSRDRFEFNGVLEECPHTAFSGFVCPEFYRANPVTGVCEATPNADGSCPGSGTFFRDIQNPNATPLCRITGTNYEVGDDPKCAVVAYGPVRCPINDPAIAPRAAGCYVLDASAPNPADRIWKEAPCSHPAFNGVQNVACAPGTPLIIREGSCAAASCTENCNLVQKYIDPAVTALTALIGVGVAIAIILGAIQYSRSANDPQVVAAAKRRITIALLTLVGFLLFSRFLNWIVPGGIGL